jgi:hypothetical protein
MNDAVHAFERAGLGKAPFRFAGLEAQDICYGERILNRAEYERTGVRVTTAPGGSCAYCGTYIVVMCNVVSADGKRFHVGTDCVEKVGDAGLRAVVDGAVTKRRRAQSKARARLAAAKLATLLADEHVIAVLTSKPHPIPYRAAEGGTLLDWAEWMRRVSGDKGTRKTVKVIEAAIAEVSR